MSEVAQSERNRGHLIVQILIVLSSVCVTTSKLTLYCAETVDFKTLELKETTDTKVWKGPNTRHAGGAVSSLDKRKQQNKERK